MPRYFIEVLYKGTAYAGFQGQQNANTIQGEVEKALLMFFRKPIALTGSSRTDAGVHALQNYFHFEEDFAIIPIWKKNVYHLNAILPPDIVVNRIFAVTDDMHCRFSATFRTYEYSLYGYKNPFLADRAYFYPYNLNQELLQAAAKRVMGEKDFESFSKRNSQVKTFRCNIYESEWMMRDGQLVYRVSANRFLRGMVRGLVGTMLKVGREQLSLDQFSSIIISGDASQVDFAVPPQGLRLVKVAY